MSGFFFFFVLCGFFFFFLPSYPSPELAGPRCGAGCAGEALCHGAAAEPPALGKNITLKKKKKQGEKKSQQLDSEVFVEYEGWVFLAVVMLFLFYFFFPRRKDSTPPPSLGSIYRSPLCRSSTQAGENKTKGDFRFCCC